MVRRKADQSQKRTADERGTRSGRHAAKKENMKGGSGRDASPNLRGSFATRVKAIGGVTASRTVVTFCQGPSKRLAHFKGRRGKKEKKAKGFGEKKSLKDFV